MTKQKNRGKNPHGYRMIKLYRLQKSYGTVLAGLARERGGKLYKYSKATLCP
jgi:hypothetical protein